MVVAGQRQRPAFGRGAGEIGVAQRIPGPVDARALAIPDAEDAIDRRAWKARQVLRAPDRGRREVLVEPRAEHDVVALEDVAGAPKLDVEAPQRRAAIAGNVTAGIETRGAVAQALLNRQAHQRLHAGHVEPAFWRQPAVLERRLRPDGRLSHESSFSD